MNDGDRSRVQRNSVASIVLWVAMMAMLLVGAPFWSTVLVGTAGAFFALLDWRIVRHAARERLSPPHHDPDVQALIDERIDVAEYLRRKEGVDSSNPSFKRTPNGTD